MTITSVVMELAIWLRGYLFGKRNNHPGRHYEDTIEFVASNYHPEPHKLIHAGLWHKRFTRHAAFAFLRIPAKTFRVWIYIDEQITAAIKCSNYGWRNVPLNEWPEGWQASNDSRT